MSNNTQRSATLPVGIVVRRLPGVTRWARWSWRPVAVLPGAGPAQWKELRRDGDAVEFHAGTVDLTLWRTDTEAYKVNLSDKPSVYVVMRESEGTDWPYRVHCATVDPYEGEAYSTSGDEIVEKLPMPEGLQAWVEAFTEEHYVETPFVKRKRDKRRLDREGTAMGDPRIAQMSDVYRAPSDRRRKMH